MPKSTPITSALLNEDYEKMKKACDKKEINRTQFIRDAVRSALAKVEL